MFFSIRQRPPPKAKNLELRGGRGKGEGPVLVIVGIANPRGVGRGISPAEGVRGLGGDMGPSPELLSPQ